jgi:Flp pilus assembly pilin Flp
MINFLKKLWKDQRGALTTVEVIGYTVLIGGAVALVGYGVTTMARGKMGDATEGISEIKAVSKPIDASSDYSSGTVTKDNDAGIVTGITPTN